MGKKASWPVNKRCWVYQAEGDATWLKITVISGDIVGLLACTGSTHGKDGGGLGVFTVDLRLCAAVKTHHSSTSSRALTTSDSLSDSAHVCLTFHAISSMTVFLTCQFTAMVIRVSFIIFVLRVCNKALLHFLLVKLYSRVSTKCILKQSSQPMSQRLRSLHLKL